MIGRRGWYGNSQGHSLAAKGVRLYARKEHYIDPIFYAKKREEDLPFYHIIQMVRQGKTYDEMRRMHPHADAEDVRLRGIKAIEAIEGNDVLSKLNTDGVDTSVRAARSNPARKAKMLQTIRDRQQSSFLPQPKVEFLKARLAE